MNRKPRILVADDQATFARAVQRALTQEGYDVDIACDGAAALEALQASNVDVLICDIQMPQVSGIGVLRAIRELGIPVTTILVTADPTVDSAIVAVEFGAMLYLTKPLKIEDLRAATRRALRMQAFASMQRELVHFQSLGVTSIEARLRRNAELTRALDSVWLAWQPLFHAATGRVYGYEALLRSADPAMPGPTELLSAAEELGRLPEVGRCVRDLAAADAARLPADAVLFINLHARDLVDPAWAADGCPLLPFASRMVLEITERAALDPAWNPRDRTAGLRARGFRIAVDDLGAGYAGLSSLAVLEPDVVKLDISLVAGLDRSPLQRKIVTSITTLCRELGILVVAEGVETPEEHGTLRDIGCDVLQGFLLGRPAPAPG